MTGDEDDAQVLLWLEIPAERLLSPKIFTLPGGTEGSLGSLPGLGQWCSSEQTGPSGGPPMTERETLAHDYLRVVSVTRRINVISGVLEGLSGNDVPVT